MLKKVEIVAVKAGPVEPAGRNVLLLDVKKGFGFFDEMHGNTVPITWISIHQFRLIALLIECFQVF